MFSSRPCFIYTRVLTVVHEEVGECHFLYLFFGSYADQSAQSVPCRAHGAR